MKTKKIIVTFVVTLLFTAYVNAASFEFGLAPYGDYIINKTTKSEASIIGAKITMGNEYAYFDVGVAYLKTASRSPTQFSSPVITTGLNFRLPLKFSDDFSIYFPLGIDIDMYLGNQNQTQTSYETTNYNDTYSTSSYRPMSRSYTSTQNNLYDGVSNMIYCKAGVGMGFKLSDTSRFVPQFTLSYGLGDVYTSPLDWTFDLKQGRLKGTVELIFVFSSGLD